MAADQIIPAPTDTVQDRVAQARASGASWDQIGEALAPRFEAARTAGATPEQIDKALGYSNGEPIFQGVQNYVSSLPDGQSEDPGKIKQFYADAVDDARAHDPGTFGNRVAAIAAGTIQGAKQGWGEGPLGEPASPNESYLSTLGRVLGMDLSAVGRGFQAGQGAVEGAFAGGGAPILGRDIAAIPEAFMGGEIPHMAGVTAAGGKIAADLPTTEELTDAAIAARLNLAPGNTTVEINGKEVQIVKGNLAKNWAMSGERPADAAERATTDGSLRDRLLTPQPPNPPHGSSETPTEGDTFVIPKNAPEPTEAAIQGAVVHARGNAADLMSSLYGAQGHDPRVQAFIENGGGDLNPGNANWCVAFVNSALEQSGIKGSGSNVATSFLNWGDDVHPADVQKGDVVVLARGHEAGEVGGHVGFATGDTRYAQGGIEVEMVSGNRSKSGDVGVDWLPASEVQVRRSDVASEANTRPDLLGTVARLGNLCKSHRPLIMI